MGKRIEGILVFTIALLYPLAPYANAGFFTELNNTRSNNEVLVEFSGTNLNSFDRIYAWNPAEDKNNLIQEIVDEQDKKNVKIIKTYTVRATAYSSTIDQTDDTPFVTASGTNVRDGILATNFLPFGTKIRIPEIYGDKVFIVEDRMNRRYWYNIDIWFPERSLAMAFGSKKVTIEIVDES